MPSIPGQISHGGFVEFGGETMGWESFDGFSHSVEAVETTDSLSSQAHKEKVKGLTDAGDLSITINHSPNMIPLTTKPKGTLVLTWPLEEGESDPAAWSCDAICTSWKPSGAVGAKMMTQVTFALSGVPTYYIGNEGTG